MVALVGPSSHHRRTSSFNRIFATPFIRDMVGNRGSREFPMTYLKQQNQRSMSTTLLAASSSWNNRGGGGGKQPSPKFLTTGDLNRIERVYTELSDFEEDVEGMAANYDPQDYEDFSLPGEEGGTMSTATSQSSNVINSKPKASEISSSATSRAPTVALNSEWGDEEEDDDETDAEYADDGEEDIAEPLSPLSFISIIADPSDDPQEGKYRESPRSKSSQPQSPLMGDRRLATLDDDTSDDTTLRHASKFMEKKEEPTISAEEFRAKHSFTPAETSFPSMVADDSEKTESFQSRIPPPVLEGSRRTDELFQLETDLKRLEEEIKVANNGVALNPSSFKQVSQALFGTPDQSVSKAVLEAICFSNALAKLILEHRLTKQRYTKLQKQEGAAEKKRKARDSPPASNSTSTPASNEDQEPLILVDTSSFIFRAYYSMPPMHRSDGLPTSAVLGFCNMLNRMVMTPLLNGKQPRLVLCCDAPSPASGGPKTIRHDLYDQYKANRAEAPMDLIPQFPLIRMAAQAYGMLWIEAPGFEADDVIASLSRKALEEGLPVHIYSGDKDLMQLVTNSSTTEGLVKMIDPMTMTHWEHDDVVEKWGVSAHQLGDVLALAGDAADNIPGVPGIGPKIAAQLLQKFGTLEELLENLDQVPQAKRREKLETYRDQAILSQKLVSLVRDLDWDTMTIDPLKEEDDFYSPPEFVGDLRMAPMDPDRILQFYEAMGFVTIKERLLERLNRQSKIEHTYTSKNPARKSGSNKGGSRPKARIPNPEDFDDVPF